MLWRGMVCFKRVPEGWLKNGVWPWRRFWDGMVCFKQDLEGWLKHRVRP